MNMINFIDKVKSADAADFVSMLERLGLIDNPEGILDDITHSIRHLKGSKAHREATVAFRDLENRWYESLASGSPDYSIYDGVAYLVESWVCWKVYSREYLKSIFTTGFLKNSNGDKTVRMFDYIGHVNTVVDLGCGIGYTTAALKEAYPSAWVVGTNVVGSNQWKVCNEISNTCGFDMKERLADIGEVDMVFASEYFEHFQAPIDHLVDVIETLRPKHILFANTFTANSPGHFNEYMVGGRLIDRRKVSRLFSKTLNEYGYVKRTTSCWNSRPTYFERDSSVMITKQLF